jgi:hypothetical protein
MCVIHKRHESVTDEYHSTMPTLPYISLSTSWPLGDKACPALHLGCVWHSSRQLQIRKTNSAPSFSYQTHPTSGQGGERTLVKTNNGKTCSLRPVGCITNQFPTKGTPTTSLRLAREVSASHDEPPLARQASASHDKSWAQTHGVCTATNVRGGMILHAMQVPQLAVMQAAHPDKSLNAGPTGCAAITSPSSPTLPHASSARGTQVPSTTRTSLDLGSGMAG